MFQYGQVQRVREAHIGAHTRSSVFQQTVTHDFQSLVHSADLLVDVDHALINAQHRLDVEQRSHQMSRPADPASLVKVVERGGQEVEGLLRQELLNVGVEVVLRGTPIHTLDESVDQQGDASGRHL